MNQDQQLQKALNELGNCQDDYQYLVSITENKGNLHGWLRMRAGRISKIRATLTATQGEADITEMIDAAMVEMKNIHPPLRRSECERLIRAAMPAANDKAGEKVVAPTEAQFVDWCERHGMQHADREAFFDAASLYLGHARPQPQAEAGFMPHGVVPAIAAIAADLIITLRQAEQLVAFFGGHDTEVSVARHEKGLLAWCTDYPGEGGQYLGDTEVDDELADKGRPITFDMVAHLTRQQVFSERTFGPGLRTQGVVDHIRKELVEVLASPQDLSEWIDVAILALDGAWRAGHTPEQIIAALVAKQYKNEGRQWPDWRTMPADQAIEHVRTGDASEPAGPKYPATFLVNTVNGPTYACMQHTRALGAVFGVLGAGTLPMPLDDDDQHECDNCLNEATTRGAA